MTKEFEKIKQVIEPFNQEIQTRRQKEEVEKQEMEKQKWEDFYRGIEKDNEILNKSGVKEIFKEIKNNGLLESESYIHESDHNTGGIIHNIGHKREVSVSLIFDICEGGSDGVGSSSKEVKIAVKDGQLNLVKHPEFNDVYTPIKEDELAQTVAEAIKNPIRWG